MEPTADEILAMDRRASPPAPAVAVKPLEWNGAVADCPFGCYTVEDRADDEWAFTFHCYPFGEAYSAYPDEDAAKAAAQADYEQRIRSALVEPAPAVAVPEGWQDISTAPQDELLLLYEPHEPREAGGFHFIGVKNRDGRWYNNLDLKEQHPTHWAPCRPDPDVAAPQPPATRSEAQPPYPEGAVVGPCVCGSWPGGRCLRCEWRPATRSYEDGIEAAARIVEGQPYGEGADNPARYRTWAHWPTLPNGTKGNRSVDDFLVKHCDALATAIRSLADEPRHGE